MRQRIPTRKAANGVEKAMDHPKLSLLGITLNTLTRDSEYPVGLNHPFSGSFRPWDHPRLPSASEIFEVNSRLFCMYDGGLTLPRFFEIFQKSDSWYGLDVLKQRNTTGCSSSISPSSTSSGVLWYLPPCRGKSATMTSVERCKWSVNISSIHFINRGDSLNL
ncbi:hypothetical protein BDV38DRAFT_241073 [Aspergillus pseudotamarii]|uniref:Uncharacterized protein n=1 Tax=Aspergillus pseudotamarii TaxID=132259 RepID=A0A5N6T1H1_ASPPS|nr:uncharacterized protein BDV38DRAFT_241073 [Aspergillus pseudotamarii]KAE8139704.1 hypothetical protein BDV38DRAFT_241073 [Aspergillus pseudotamarii]